MNPLYAAVQSRLDRLEVPLQVDLPDGTRLGAAQPKVTLTLADLGSLAHLASGAIGRLAEDHVEGRLQIDGAMRDVIAVAGRLVDADPTRTEPPAPPLRWWHELLERGRSAAHHTPSADRKQVEFHYDVSDDFYALWLDPRRVYSCAYFRDPRMTLADAQAAKLDHVCRKLALKPGERFLDIGAGWGGLLLWAAERYGVTAHGITLSRNQHAHLQRRIAERRLAGRVTVELADYRELPEDRPWDKIASVGMVEHVGRAKLGTYFRKIFRLLRPGGLLLNHGISAAGTHNNGLGAGIGEFIERCIFPGGELVHVSQMIREAAEAGLEPLDAESLRPHYARTLWAWSDALEAQLDAARRTASERVVRAYRLYLAGSAMSFERGWISLFQILAARPSGELEGGAMRGAQSDYPFNRDYVYRP